MKEQIIYKLISKAGGIDGRDHTDKGGQLMRAFLSRHEAEASGMAPWCEIVPEVVNMSTARAVALAKLNAIDRLALGLNC